MNKTYVLSEEDLNNVLSAGSEAIQIVRLFSSAISEEYTTGFEAGFNTALRGLGEILEKYAVEVPDDLLP